MNIYYTEENLKQFTKTKLIEICEENKLKKIGYKSILIQRILECYKTNNIIVKDEVVIPEIKEYNIWVASFDIGKLNFSFYIEEINLEELKNIKKIPLCQRYNSNGTCTDKFKEVLKKVYKYGKKILLKNIDLTPGTNKKKYYDIELCYNMTDVLNKYAPYFDNVSYFVVEQQMAFKKKCNTMALKLGQHCMSYFIIKYGREKKVFEFPAYNKTQILGCEKVEGKIGKIGKIKYINIGDKARKKWCETESICIYNEREDYETINEINSVLKKNDICDNTCQMQAFKILHFLDGKYF